MGAKTCQLCGKPLGLIRSGSGGDFCSREHRNQYRLRRSMDCLTEAHKFSTLARRRENPKPVFADAVPGPRESGPRGHFETVGFQNETGWRPVPAAPELRVDSHAQLPEAAVVRVPGGGLPAGAPREFGMKFAVTSPVVSPSGPTLAWRPGDLAGQSGRLRQLSDAPARGNALRVAASAGIRPHASGVALVPLNARRIALAAGMRPSKNVRELAMAQPAEWAAAPRPAVLNGHGSSDTAPRGPSVPPPRYAAGFAAPGRLSSELASLNPRGHTDKRLVFTGIGFTGAPESPARLDWIRNGPQSAAGMEHS